MEPAEKIRHIGVGDTTDFKIWFIARPLPRADQWHWEFSARNITGLQNTVPRSVTLTVSDGVTTLSLKDIGGDHYGNYFIWTANAYGGWKKEDLVFTLMPLGKSVIYLCLLNV